MNTLVEQIQAYENHCRQTLNLQEALTAKLKESGYEELVILLSDKQDCPLKLGYKRIKPDGRQSPIVIPLTPDVLDMLGKGLPLADVTAQMAVIQEALHKEYWENLRKKQTKGLRKCPTSGKVTRY